MQSSSRGQKDDLERQEKYLKVRYPTNEFITDIGSGLNFKRKGIKTILEYAYRGEIEELVVAYKDRLCRFGFEIFEFVISEFSKGRIIILNNRTVSKNEEFVSDILSIINVFRQELMDYENIKQVFKPNLEQKMFLRTMRVRLFPTLKQRNILNLWFGVYRRFYNKAKHYSESHGNICSFKKLRNEMRASGEYEIPNKWKENEDMIPERIITGAIKDFCSNLQGCFTKIRNGDIKFFEIHEKKKKDLSQTLNLESQCFSKVKKTKNTLFKTYSFRNRTSKNLGTTKGLKIRGFYKKGKARIKLCDIDIEKDSRISYENLNFFLLIPYMKEELKTNPRHTVISLDSGIRTFQTGYCPEGHTIEICKDTNSKLKKYYSRLDELNTRYFATKKDNGSFAKDFKGKRTAISRRRKRYFEKIRNIIDDMHWKTIKFLTENYQDIIISDFRVKELLQLNELRHISKRVLSSLSHYRFRQRLIEKCQARGNYLGIFDESSHVQNMFEMRENQPKSRIK